MSGLGLNVVLESLDQLSPAERAQVKARIERLDPTRTAQGRFRDLSGGLSPEDAAAMIQAAQECERIDPRGW
jgi:hypothetical protein